MLPRRRIGGTLRSELPAANVFHEQRVIGYGTAGMSNAYVTEMATQIVYAAVARYEGRPFTPIMAVLMEDAGNKALRERMPGIHVSVAPRLNANGILDLVFRPLAPAPKKPAFGEGTVDLVNPDGSKVRIGTASEFEAAPA